MNQDEIREKIKKLEVAEFLLQMKDFWNASDFARSREYASKIKELKTQLEEN